MKFIFSILFLFSLNSLAIDQTPDEFVKVQLNKMLDGEEISLLKTTNDYYPTIFVTDKVVIKKVVQTQVKKQIKYFKALVSFNTQEKIEQDPLHQHQTKTKAKTMIKTEELELTLYFKKESAEYQWTTKLEEIFVHKNKVNLFLK